MWLWLASVNPESQILPHFLASVPGETEAQGFLAQPGASVGVPNAHPPPPHPTLANTGCSVTACPPR